MTKYFSYTTKKEVSEQEPVKQSNFLKDERALVLLLNISSAIISEDYDSADEYFMQLIKLKEEFNAQLSSDDAIEK